MKTFFARLLYCAAALLILAPVSVNAQTTSTPKPTCTIFSSSFSVNLGGTVNLSWQSTNATGGTITSIGSVGPSGVQGVIPTPPSTTYVGTFTGAGGTGTCSVTITVVQPSGSGTVNSPGSVQNPGTVDAPGSVGQAQTANQAPTLGTGQSVTPSSNTTGGSGLIPCNGLDCQACHLAQLSQNIINFLIGLSIPLAAVMFAYAGFLFFTSSAVNKLGRARDIFKSVLIGFAIVLGAWLAVQTILHTVLSDQYYQSWNTIQCVNDARRPKDATISQLLSQIQVLSVLNSSPSAQTSGGGGTNTGPGSEFSSSGSLGSCPAGYSYLPDADTCSNADGSKLVDPGYQNSGAKGVCPSGSVYLPDADSCSDQAGNITDPIAFPAKGTSGALCADGNPACSTAALQEYGLNQAQANAMSCIAITESGGNPNTPNSSSGACGTFQITNQTSRSNWQNPAFHGDSCNTSSSCNDAACNLQTAVIMFNQQGYQPWTGICNSPGGCGGTAYGQPWNANARSCVQKYDPGNL